MNMIESDRSDEGFLAVIGTPIGNLSDITYRAKEVLSTVDTVLAEDTRVTAKLLNHLGIEVPIERCDEHTIRKRSSGVVERVLLGEKIAFVSDAGMPGVSDPGVVLVDAARDAGARVEVIPGPSAVTCAIAASGLDAQTFYFAGFPPRKAVALEAYVESLSDIPGALVFFESPHRVYATVDILARSFPERRAAVCRELTKMHEEIIRGPLPEVASELSERERIRGEVVIVVEAPSISDPAGRKSGALALDLEEFVELRRLQGISKSQIAKEASARFGMNRREIYDVLVQDEH